MAAVLPIVLQLAPLVPGLIDMALKIVEAVKSDPQTPEEVRAQLDDIASHLDAAVKAVKDAPLPKAQA